jgi:hypothetical protein
MFSTRRFFVRNALQTIGGLTAVSLLPRTVFAGCKSDTAGFDFNHEGQAVIPDWKLGDCELRSTTLRASGNFIIANGQVCTHHTHTKDVWHMKIEIITRPPTNPSQVIVIGSGNIDGPKMSELDKPLFHPFTGRIAFNPQLAHGHGFAARVTSCC